MPVDIANAIGSMSTTGMMSHFIGLIRGKLYEEVLQRMLSKRDAVNTNAEANFIDPEALKEVYLDTMEERGVEVLLYTIHFSLTLAVFAG